jgi:8-oxo-dGTP diphosphatase
MRRRSIPIVSFQRAGGSASSGFATPAICAILAGAVRELSDIDWATYSPRDRATLLFVLRAGEVLLIRKKRGLGAGKVNAPGGRIESGESALDAAIREAWEEVGVRAIGAEEVGWLAYQFIDGYSLSIRVFRAADCEGDPRETAEAIPMWVPVDRIPFESMWADDSLWLPMMLRGSRFWGRFIFDGDRMLAHDVGGDPESPDALALFRRIA